MLRLLVRLVMLVVVVLVLAMGLSMVASETGEVVVLRTTGADGAPHETRLWVVDEGGRAWLRAGDPQSTWLLRIQQSPTVEVERDGRTATYTAAPQPEARDRLNPLFAEKYGWADAYVALLFGRDDATPIRLDPEQTP